MNIARISKALAGFLSGVVIMYMTKNNIIIADGLADSLEIVIGAVIVFASVYISPPNKG